MIFSWAFVLGFFLGIGCVIGFIFLSTWFFISGPGSGGAGIDEEELLGYPNDHHPDCPVYKTGSGRNPWVCPDCKQLRSDENRFDEKV